ncbi:MAG: nucleotidyltransferase domain-containing protein, partial [Candidatus Dadabacteria bacterium]
MREAAERLGRERPEVRFVGLFGSLAKGTAV